MTTDISDPVGIVVTELTTSWLSANTDNVTPVIAAIYDYKQTYSRNSDYVFIFAGVHSEKPIGIGFDSFDYTDTVRVDIRTTASRSRLYKLVNEVRRIVYAKCKGLTPYGLLSITEENNDLSDKSIQLWRFMMNVKLWRVIQTI